MAAPKGNKFWKNRTKHGRDKIFSTPDILWDEACKYFQWADDNPLIKNEQKRGSQKIDILELFSISKKENIDINTLLHDSISGIIEIPVPRPYTLTALCLYLGINTQYFKTFKAQLNEDDPLYEDYNTVITRIEETIYTQKFEGSAIGLFNQNIIARDLGLSDKKELDHTTKGERINIISLGNGEAITKTE
ncbi:terminase small subunit [Paenimyroides ceti]